MESVFGVNDSGIYAGLLPRYQPVSVISIPGAYIPLQEDDTWISMSKPTQSTVIKWTFYDVGLGTCGKIQPARPPPPPSPTWSPPAWTPKTPTTAWTPPTMFWTPSTTHTPLPGPPPPSQNNTSAHNSTTYLQRLPAFIMPVASLAVWTMLIREAGQGPDHEGAQEVTFRKCVPSLPQDPSLAQTRYGAHVQFRLVQAHKGSPHEASYYRFSQALLARVASGLRVGECGSFSCMGSQMAFSRLSLPPTTMGEYTYSSPSFPTRFVPTDAVGICPPALYDLSGSGEVPSDSMCPHRGASNSPPAGLTYPSVPRSQRINSSTQLSTTSSQTIFIQYSSSVLSWTAEERQWIMMAVRAILEYGRSLRHASDIVTRDKWTGCNGSRRKEEH
ncbi:hypothetical protein JOM56_013593 [Amanita muscaria]